MNLTKMTDAQIESYALENSISLSGCKTKAEKIARITDSEAHQIVSCEAMGIKCDVDVAVFNDFDYLYLLGEVSDGNVLMLPKLIKMLFGDKWLDIRNQLEVNGQLTAARATAFFTEVMEQVGAKNL